jgi:hypothetical protein
MRIDLPTDFVEGLMRVFSDEPIYEGGPTLCQALSHDRADNDCAVLMFLQGKVSSFDGQKKVKAQALLNQFVCECLARCQPGFGLTRPIQEGQLC